MDAEAYADMLPWLVFLVIDRKSGLSVAWAAGCATACSAGLAGWAYWRGRRAPLPLAALAFFVPCYFAALASPSWDAAIGVSRSVAVLAVSITAFASLRFTPISEAYTTPLVAPGVPSNPSFRRVNVEMTTAWGVGSLMASVTCAVATLVEGRVAGTFTFTFMDWVIPLVIATGTVLWATRRWELFRLGLDEAGGGDSAVAQPVPLRAYEPVALSSPGPDDAVIHDMSERRMLRVLGRRTL